MTDALEGSSPRTRGSCSRAHTLTVGDLGRTELASSVEERARAMFRSADEKAFVAAADGQVTGAAMQVTGATLMRLIRGGSRETLSQFVPMLDPFGDLLVKLLRDLDVNGGRLPL